MKWYTFHKKVYHFFYRGVERATMLLDKLLNRNRSAGPHTEQYEWIVKQMSATSSERAHGGYSAEWWHELTEAEKDELEAKIWRKYPDDSRLAVFLPKLAHHDGITRLEKDLRNATSISAKVELADVLFRETGEKRYLDVLRHCCSEECGNGILSGYRLVAVALQNYPADPEVEAILRDVYQGSSDGATLTTALIGILHQRGIVHDANDFAELNVLLPKLRHLDMENPDGRLARLDQYLATAT
ncbi:MAG: hypothetical protein Q4G41_00805 [Coriobacteriales bacterium]|nr:hypothetical protein [Coriobacteriales bacterium]